MRFFEGTFNSISLLDLSERKDGGCQVLRKGMVVMSHQGDEGPVLRLCNLFVQILAALERL